jgi:hypothetical protein
VTVAFEMPGIATLANSSAAAESEIVLNFTVLPLVIVSVELLQYSACFQCQSGCADHTGTRTEMRGYQRRQKAIRDADEMLANPIEITRRQADATANDNVLRIEDQLDVGA